MIDIDSGLLEVGNPPNHLGCESLRQFCAWWSLSIC